MSPRLSCLFLGYKSGCSGLQPEFLVLGSALSFQGLQRLAEVMLTPKVSDACSQEVPRTHFECRGGLCFPVCVWLWALGCVWKVLDLMETFSNCSLMSPGSREQTGPGAGAGGWPGWGSHCLERSRRWGSFLGSSRQVGLAAEGGF